VLLGQERRHHLGHDVTHGDRRSSAGGQKGVHVQDEAQSLDCKRVNVMILRRMGPDPGNACLNHVGMGLSYRGDAELEKIEAVPMGETLARHGQIARLLMQHRTALYGYIYACVRNHADAEDILQNVSVAVTESFDRLNDEAGFLPWAREIARRRILAHRRASGREQAFDPELLSRIAEAAERVEQSCSSSVHRSALLSCLESLPPRSRKLISLRYEGSVKGMQELADQFGRTVQSIYAQVKRIKQRLRDCVKRRLSLEVP
jgi:RNA polymerase sigma-70 factor (ECF subfamily)